ncbi:Restriction endonuclease type II-like [Ostreococcus tauri]|jgi:DNA excision repair protein ERCC-1|uniref:Nucleotide repair protein n=1 Tax=Ostreococcus tauri TaxID=70448 RepID=Q00SZ4_OSTTA|nr:Restriction endonuclease type II-like [Ostreococcus tauri]OUS45243.1 nucleotide repair protein [Ostreococcus tauri]CAL58470.1 Restriction endonuclease type II-like [Ostreococcus tauri]|eukprot:XP_003084054.1 Restriction endonuclease type II-like [Ostreococcus tauri]
MPNGNQTSLLVNSRSAPLFPLNLLKVKYSYENLKCDFVCGHVSILYCTLSALSLNEYCLKQKLLQLSVNRSSVVVLCLVDSEDGMQILTSLNKLCVCHNAVLICTYALDEAAAYLHALCVLSQETSEPKNTPDQDVYSILSSIRGINKVDAKSICHNSRSFADICASTLKRNSDCPGVGPTKAQNLRKTLQKPFMMMNRMDTSA